LLNAWVLIYLTGVGVSWLRNMGAAAADPVWEEFRANPWYVTGVALLAAAMWPMDLVSMPIAIYQAMRK